MFKKTFITFLLTFLIIPFSVLAYSDKLIVGGQNIGITLNASGVLVVGTYDVGGTNPGKDAGLEKGDTIISINGTSIETIDEMASEISTLNSSEIEIEYTRDSQKQTTTLKLYKEDDVYKTGLYVKDSITGIGTLTFIDPETKIFGALGHEIQEQTTGQILEIKDGKIFDSTVTGIIRSSDGNAGEKKAEYNADETTGEVFSNTTQGVFGTYTGDLVGEEYEVADPDEVEEGKASILTVLDGTKVEEYSIKITKINKSSQKNRNFVFEITDEDLIEKTGGIIQGMSGSPIIQNNKIIGAVTHVVVDNPYKGYGIFITNMLEEAEK